MGWQFVVFFFFFLVRRKLKRGAVRPYTKLSMALHWPLTQGLAVLKQSPLTSNVHFLPFHSCSTWLLCCVTKRTKHLTFNTRPSVYEPGIAAATMFTPGKMTEVSETQLRVAFDGDAVLFSDESERIYKAHGLEKFFEHEKAHENKLLDHVGHTLTDIIFQLMEMMTELFWID